MICMLALMPFAIITLAMGAHGDRELRSWITIGPGSGPYWQPCTEIR
jgi:hypothetical protein